MTKNLLVKAQELLNRINNNPKVQDVNYLDKKTLSEELKPFEFSSKFNKRTTRTEMVKALAEYVKTNSKTEQPTPKKEKSEAQVKTDKLIAKLIEIAKENEKNNYGFTVSNFKLQAIILEIGIGLKELKGHTISEDEQELVDKVYKWLIKKGYIQQTLYKIKENDYTRVYAPNYPGRKESRKYLMIPLDEAVAKKLTIVEATSFLVCCKPQ